MPYDEDYCCDDNPDDPVWDVVEDGRRARWEQACEQVAKQAEDDWNARLAELVEVSRQLFDEGEV